MKSNNIQLFAPVANPDLLNLQTIANLQQVVFYLQKNFILKSRNKLLAVVKKQL